MDHDTLVEVAKATPPAAYAAFKILGHTLPDWVSLLTFFYLIGLLCQQLYRLYVWLRKR